MDEARPLVECVNARYVPRVWNWHKAMSDLLPSVQAVGAWWSRKPRLTPLTIVTQLSANRLQQLRAQCESWGGPISAAVYLGIPQYRAVRLEASTRAILSEAAHNVSSFFEEIEQSGRCQLDILLVYELFQEERAIMLYPVNAMRNLARLQAKTPMIALLDVDMLVSRSLSEDLKKVEVAAKYEQQCKDKNVFVLPAFETYGADVPEAASFADSVVSNDKKYLIGSIKLGVAAPFDSKRFVLGHAATNYSHWYEANENYAIQYSYRYEPWLICDRKDVPWHDVRYRGYGQNKIVHVASLNASGFQFNVHASAFIAHRAHEHTAARKELVKDIGLRLANQLADFKTSVYGHSATLWTEAQQQMAAGTYKPAMDHALKYCLAKLPWWN